MVTPGERWTQGTAYTVDQNRRANRGRNANTTSTRPTSTSSSTSTGGRSSSSSSSSSRSAPSVERGSDLQGTLALWNQLNGGGGSGAYGASSGYAPALMSAASVQIPAINLPAAPSNPAQAMMDAARRAYQGRVDYAKSVIPYYEQREAASKGEIQDLRNIAQASWSEAGGTIREGGAEASQRTTEQTQDIMGTLEAGADADTAALQAAVDRSGLGERTRNVGSNINAASTQAQANVGAEGSLAGELISSATERNAGYADQLAALQDTAAAADIALLGQNINELIFRQQGRIADVQGEQAAAAMQAAIQGQQMYDQAYGRHVGYMMDAARMQQQAALQNAQFAQSANQYNAGALNDAAAAAMSSGADGGVSLSDAIALYNMDVKAGERATPQEHMMDYLEGQNAFGGDTSVMQRRIAALQSAYQAAMSRVGEGQYSNVNAAMRDVVAGSSKGQEGYDATWKYITPQQMYEWIRLNGGG